MSSNLPPGVTPSMVPGNRPEDMALEAAEEWAMDELSKAGLRAEEYEIAIKVGIAAVIQAREIARKWAEDARAEERQYQEWRASQES